MENDMVAVEHLNWQALDHVHTDYSSVKGILLCLKTI